MRSVVFRGAEYPLGGRFAGEYRGFSYCCPACGDLWGKLVLAERGIFAVITWPCENHGTQFQTGGSFLKPLLWWDKAGASDPKIRLETLSGGLLRHEALMKAKQILEK